MQLHILINDFNGRLKVTIPAVPQYSFISDDLGTIQVTVKRHMEEYFKKHSEEFGSPYSVLELDASLFMQVNVLKPTAIMSVMLDDLQEGIDYVTMEKVCV